jgi:hypothetical protein
MELTGEDLDNMACGARDDIGNLVDGQFLCILGCNGRTVSVYPMTNPLIVAAGGWCPCGRGEVHWDINSVLQTHSIRHSSFACAAEAAMARAHFDAEEAATGEKHNEEVVPAEKHDEEAAPADTDDEELRHYEEEDREYMKIIAKKALSEHNDDAAPEETDSDDEEVKHQAEDDLAFMKWEKEEAAMKEKAEGDKKAKDTIDNVNANIQNKEAKRRKLLEVADSITPQELQSIIEALVDMARSSSSTSSSSGR